MPSAQIVQIAIVLTVLGLLFLSRPIIALYVNCRLSGAKIRFLHLVGMTLRKVNVRDVAFARIRLKKGGIDIPVDRLETHWLAGGSLAMVSSALIVARSAKVPITWDVAAAIDLAGYDLFAGVDTLINGSKASIVDEDAAIAIASSMQSAGLSTHGLHVPSGGPPPDLGYLVGAVGEVAEELHPEGRIRIGNRLYRARARAGSIPVGAIVRVAWSLGDRLDVERAS